MNWPRLNTRPATRRRRSWRPSLEEVEGRQLLSNTPLYVLGTNGNLWLEAPGWQQDGRTWVDSNVQAFAPTPMPPATCTWRGPTTTSGWSPPGGSSTGAPGSTATSRPSPPA